MGARWVIPHGTHGGIQPSTAAASSHHHKRPSSDLSWPNSTTELEAAALPQGQIRRRLGSLAGVDAGSAWAEKMGSGGFDP